MRSWKTKHLILAAMMTALCLLFTLVIRIPSPTGGYINIGDCAVLLSGWMLGPFWGAASAGLGSAMADLFGYPLYAPATLVIKGGMAALAGWLVNRKRSSGSAPSFLLCLEGGILGEALMILGYFLFEGWFLGMGYGAVVNVPGGLVQGAAGLALALMVRAALPKGLYLLPHSRD